MKVYKQVMKFCVVILIVGLLITVTGFILGGNYTTFSKGKTNEIVEVYEGVQSIDIDLSVSKVDVRKGNEFKVIASGVNTNTFSSTVSNGIWYIKDKPKVNISFFNFNNYNSNIVIYIPEDNILNDVNIKFGAGEFTADKFISNDVNINVGVGSLKIYNLVSNSATIVTGVGETDIQGVIRNNASIKCGVGSISLNLIGNETDYNYNLNVGVGEVKINNTKHGGFVNRDIDNNSNKIFNIECGVGSVNLKINE